MLALSAGYLRLRGEVEVFEEQRFTAVPMSGAGAGGWLRLRGGFWGTHAYLVTARGAQRLLDSAEPIASQVDAYMGWQAEFDPAFVIHTNILDAQKFQECSS